MTNGKILLFCLFALPIFSAILTNTPTCVMLEGTLVSPPLCYCRQFIVPRLQRVICVLEFIVSRDTL
jgi:hypothetical protein